MYRLRMVNASTCRADHDESLACLVF